MPRKKAGNPIQGFEVLVDFLRAQLSEDNFKSLTDDGVGDDWPSHIMDSGGYDLARAKRIQARLRGILDRQVPLDLTPEEMLLIRFNALVTRPRRRWLLLIGERGVALKPTLWWNRLRLCPIKAPGCQCYYVELSGRRRMMHCRNIPCRTRHDNAVRVKRTTQVRSAR